MTVHESLSNGSSMPKEEIEMFNIMSRYTTVIVFASISTLITMTYLVFAEFSDNRPLYFAVDLIIKVWDILINTICLSMQFGFAQKWFHCCCYLCDRCCKFCYIHRHVQHVKKMETLNKQSYQPKLQITVVASGSQSPRDLDNSD